MKRAWMWAGLLVVQVGVARAADEEVLVTCKGLQQTVTLTSPKEGQVHLHVVATELRVHGRVPSKTKWAWPSLAPPFTIDYTFEDDCQTAAGEPLLYMCGGDEATLDVSGKNAGGKIEHAQVRTPDFLFRSNVVRTKSVVGFALRDETLVDLQLSVQAQNDKDEYGPELEIWFQPKECQGKPPSWLGGKRK